MTTDSLGRKILLKNNIRKPSGYIILTYLCRALEWSHLRKAYAACLEQFGYAHLKSILDEVLFAWKYHNNMASLFYRPTLVFKRWFSFLHLLDETHTCICLSSKRMARFLDPSTLEEISSYAPPAVHVCTVDLNIIHHRSLRQALSMGMIHIPLKPTTSFTASIVTVLDGFTQLAQILNLVDSDFLLEQALDWLRLTCLEQLKTSFRSNRFGFRHSKSDLLRDQSATNELNWLMQHLYCSGLDKAANNASFICIKHMQLMALEQLSGPDFVPCKENSVWLLPATILQYKKFVI